MIVMMSLIIEGGLEKGRYVSGNKIVFWGKILESLRGESRGRSPINHVLISMALLEFLPTHINSIFEN